jgi:hypothetical protein
MIKRLLERFRQNRGQHKATVRIDFFPGDLVTPHIFWQRPDQPDADIVELLIFLYARILYELAELNELRVARQLMDFLKQVADRLGSSGGTLKRFQLPLGEVRLTEEPGGPVVRTYQAEFYRLQDGNFRLEFHGSLGKESFYLPGAFLALLQSCLDRLEEEPIRRLTRALARLHSYYRYRRDFWEGGALTSAPVFALGTEELPPGEARPEA